MKKRHCQQFISEENGSENEVKKVIDIVLSRIGTQKRLMRIIMWGISLFETNFDCVCQTVFSVFVIGCVYFNN